MSNVDAERKLIRDRAAEWVCELQEEDSPQRHAEFCTWVRQSPRHIEEFLFATTAWKALDRAGPQNEVEVQAAIDRALAMARHEGENVVALRQAPVVPAHRVKRVTGVRFAIAAAIGLMAIAGAVWWSVSTFAIHPNYVTAAGEQRTVRLPDGSLLHLNTKSQVEVRFSDTERDIRLADGEALFVVAQDPTRPFRVNAGSTVIQAVGTQFNVKQRAEGLRISVLEGRVKVIAGARKNELLASGDEANVSHHQIKIVKRSVPEVTDAIAWRERRLVFRGNTLDEIVAEISRYSPERRLRVEGEAAGQKRFAGTFSADDSQALVRFLKQYDDLSVEMREREIVIRMR